jgi:hypothetical protein
VFIASLSIQIRRAGVQKKFGGTATRIGMQAFAKSWRKE